MKQHFLRYHLPDFNWRFIPPTARPDQYHVIFTQESPMTNWFKGPSIQIPGFFNLTMTYRSDSDVTMSYGFVIENNQANWFNFTKAKELVAKKSKPVAWVVSHCTGTSSKREHYVEALRKFIQVDVFGKCSKDGRKCPHNIEVRLNAYNMYLI